jgi:hypothetical protein
MKNLDFPKIHKLLLDLHEAGRVSGISPWSLRDDIHAGKLPCYRRGGPRGKILISPRDLDSYLARYRIGPVIAKQPNELAGARKPTLQQKSDSSVPKTTNVIDDFSHGAGSHLASKTQSQNKRK